RVSFERDRGTTFHDTGGTADNVNAPERRAHAGIIELAAEMHPRIGTDDRLETIDDGQLRAELHRPMKLEAYRRRSRNHRDGAREVGDALDRIETSDVRDGDRRSRAPRRDRPGRKA